MVTKILVAVRTRSKKNEVEKVDTENYTVYTSQAPEKGKANKEVIQLLADYFDTIQANIEIVQGKSVYKKVIIIRK